MSLRVHAEAVPLPLRRSTVRAAVVSLRPRQWTKNLLLLAAIVFAGELVDGRRWLAAVLALGAYCLASSAAYLLNDLHDADADRLHPVKRLRPLARGELTREAATALAVTLALSALAAVATLGPASFALLAGFLVLQGLYTTVLRDVPLVDVAAIAFLFVLRAAAGAVAISVPISPWLLACTGLLALLLALGKRRAEAAGVGGARSRPSLGRVRASVLDLLLAVTAAATLAVYATYAVTTRGGGLLVVTLPLVVAGVARYLQLVHGRQAGEDPENILLRDRPTLVIVASWAAACAALVQLGSL